MAAFGASAPGFGIRALSHALPRCLQERPQSGKIQHELFELVRWSRRDHQPCRGLLFRIHALLGEHEAAERSRQQYIEFCQLLLLRVHGPDSPYPFEVVEETRPLKELVKRTEALDTPDADLVIDVTYDELKIADV